MALLGFQDAQGLVVRNMNDLHLDVLVANLAGTVLADQLEVVLGIVEEA